MVVECKNCGAEITFAGAGNNFGWVHLRTFDARGNPLNCEKAEPESTLTLGEEKEEKK